jgi:hypothetical protein
VVIIKLRNPLLPPTYLLSIITPAVKNFLIKTDHLRTTSRFCCSRPSSMLLVLATPNGCLILKMGLNLLLRSRFKPCVNVHVRVGNRILILNMQRKIAGLDEKRHNTYCKFTQKRRKNLDFCSILSNCC